MIDIIGNIKIDESKPERINYLVACIRSYLFLKDHCRFILNIDNPSNKLENIIREELKPFEHEIMISGTSILGSYGKVYKTLMECSDNKYILNFFEDHFCVCDDVGDMASLLHEMEQHKADVCKTSFFKIEKNSIKNIKLKKSTSPVGDTFFANPIFFKDYQKHYGTRFYIGVNFLTTREFAFKFWDRNSGTRPHEYEIAPYDTYYLHTVFFPNFEITSSIDDNHGEDKTCLLERTDCEKWNTIWSDVSSSSSVILSVVEGKEHIENVGNKVIHKGNDGLVSEKPIQLFNIPSYKIDTAQFSNLLHDKIVTEFENNFAQYVGAKYAVSFNSATSAIFLATYGLNQTIEIPSIIPPVVANALINAGNKVVFKDNTDWVGHSYPLCNVGDFKYFIWDSAQKVKRNQFMLEADAEDLMIFSFYPTKPVGSCDGGMIVSNDKAKIDHLRQLSMNGMGAGINNWEREIKCIGHKMYMNSIQAYIANENLKRLPDKKAKLAVVCEKYNQAFGIKNTSYHLYRVRVADNKEFIRHAKKEGIVCGLHYDALHCNPLYSNIKLGSLPKSEADALEMVSIPFHEELTDKQIDKVIKFVNENKNVLSVIS